MKAFVKTTKGTFPNVNFYLAWEAFNTLGYSVTCFEEEDIGALDVSPTTPVFAGVSIFRKIIDKMGVNYPPFDCYPEVLNPYYGRTLRKSTVGEERKKFLKDGVSVFVKPVEPKKFLGHVWSSMLNLIPITNIADETPCWVCEPLNIRSEFRVYVQDGEILGVKHYWGDWDLTPSKTHIEHVIQEYKGAPVAYGIDFAVADMKNSPPQLKICNNIVMEVNDGCNLGNYGLDAIHYGEMIVARWFEIMEQGGKGSDLRKESLKNYAAEIYNKVGINDDTGIPEVTIDVGSKPLVTGYMKYMIGNFRIDRDEYWFLTDAERQALHDKHNPGSKAIPFDPRFAEKYGKNPNGPF